MNKKSKKEISEMTEFASFIAHQLKSPVASASSLIKTLLNEYLGTLNNQQRDFLIRAEKRLDEAISTSTRMINLADPSRVKCQEGFATDLSAVIKSVCPKFMEEAAIKKISLDTYLDLEPAYVSVSEEALTEILISLIGNSFKYTPEDGKINVGVKLDDENKDMVKLVISDSGIGIPEENYQKIFQPFFRTCHVKESALPGSGLGLALVKNIVSSVNGKIEVGKSPLGGAEFTVYLKHEEKLNEAMIQPSIWDNSKKVVIIGGVAAGSKVASKVIRLSPDTEVTVIEKGDILSYSGCGLPYYVSGVVSKPALLSTAVRELRSPALFSNVKNVVIYNKTECIEIDREKKKIKMRSLINSNESWISYDKLVLATGSCPLIPDIKNVRVYKEIYTLHGVNDAEEIKAALAPRKAKDVVIVGGGLIGVEMTEALVARGCRVTIIEQQSRILNGILDEEVSLLVERHMEEHGVRIMTDTSIKSFYKPEEVQSDLSELKKFSSSRRKLYVTTERETIAVDFVIIAAGVVPNVELARKAGLELGITGALKVDKSMRTSDPDIYAAGDCAEAYGIVDGNPYYMPLGSTANKEGRVAAVNLCGGEEIFHGINGTVVCKVFDFCVARTGLKESMALAEGYETVSSLTSGPDREHFMPGAKKTMMLKLIVNKKTRTVLGAQSIGTARGFGKIDVIATAMAGKLTIDEIANLDFCYAPSYSLAMDSVITAANVAKNKIDGIFEWITTKEVYDKINKREEFILLDVRSHNEFQDIRIPGSILIPLNALRGRIHELPYDSEIVVYCSISLRGYEAALILKAANFKRVKVMDGGIAMWPYDVLRGI